jgi:hypothetical protein
MANNAVSEIGLPLTALPKIISVAMPCILSSKSGYGLPLANTIQIGTQRHRGTAKTRTLCQISG